MRKVRLAALALLASWAVGCLSVDSVIKVKADGTGTIEQTTLINSSAMGMMSMMGGSDAAGGGSKPAGLDPSQLFTTDKLSAEAAKLGDGVTFVSSTPVTQGEMKGVKAVYAFTDFNALRVSTALPDMEGDAAKVTGKGEKLPLVLTKRPGSSLITLDMYGELAKADANGTEMKKPEGLPEGMPKEMMAMLAPMFKDMRVAIAIEPVGTLVRTNATHVTGQRVTLFDVAFGEVFADPSGVEKLEKLGNNPSMTQIRDTLKGMKGIRINEVEKLEIEIK